MTLCFSTFEGVPAAYDLSNVIASGSAVSHNNLIPLGRYKIMLFSSLVRKFKVAKEHCQTPNHDNLHTLLPSIVRGLLLSLKSICSPIAMCDLFNYVFINMAVIFRNSSSAWWLGSLVGNIFYVSHNPFVVMTHFLNWLTVSEVGSRFLPAGYRRL